MCPTVCQSHIGQSLTLAAATAVATTHATAILTSPAPNDVASVCVAVPAPELLLPLLLLFAAAVDAIVAAVYVVEVWFASKFECDRIDLLTSSAFVAH